MAIKKIWLFTITGKDETEVHGKAYRVKISKAADKKKISGSVRNIKSIREIEVRVASEEGEASEFKAALEQAMNKDREEEEKLIFGECVHLKEDDGKYQGFSVIREDELTEMVWALQGAGGVFLSSSEKILDLMVARDFRKERGLLGALGLEVGFIVKRAGDMITGIQGGKAVKFQFEQDCLRKALVEPAWSDNDTFLQLTSDLFHSINRSDKPEFGSISSEDQVKELDSLRKVASEYYKIIDDRIEELDKRISKKAGRDI